MLDVGWPLAAIQLRLSCEIATVKNSRFSLQTPMHDSLRLQTAQPHAVRWLFAHCVWEWAMCDILTRLRQTGATIRHTFQRWGPRLYECPVSKG